MYKQLYSRRSISRTEGLVTVLCLASASYYCLSDGILDSASELQAMSSNDFTSHPVIVGIHLLYDLRCKRRLYTTRTKLGFIATTPVETNSPPHVIA